LPGLGKPRIAWAFGVPADVPPWLVGVSRRVVVGVPFVVFSRSLE
jgi:hypothetical protein